MHNTNRCQVHLLQHEGTTICIFILSIIPLYNNNCFNAQIYHELGAFIYVGAVVKVVEEILLSNWKSLVQFLIRPLGKHRIPPFSTSAKCMVDGQNDIGRRRIGDNLNSTKNFMGVFGSHFCPRNNYNTTVGVKNYF